MKKWLFWATCLLTSNVLAENTVKYVNPFIGTSNFGATHPGAQYPHGLASVVPFNVAYGQEKGNKFDKDASWHSRPYVHENNFLTGFSHVNLSGVGCPELGAILTMPTTGGLKLNPADYGSTYKNEQASPGYYSAELDKYKTKVEVSSTIRTGLSKYTFPAGQANVIVNLGLALTNETGGMVKVVSDNEVEGYRTIGTFCYRSEDVRPVYFVAKFSKPAKQSGTWKKMPKYQGVEGDWVKFNDTYKTYAGYRQPMAGDNVGAYFTFDTNKDEEILLKVGISYVSIDNARANLNAEQPKFDFEKNRRASTQAWNKLLSRIQVEGTDDKKTVFYTALYHMLIHPNILQDVNGDYPLMGQNGVGNITKGNRYTTFSLWDTSRNLHPFLSLVYPELQSDMVNSMLGMAKESGWMPKWELLGMETEVMVGDPATPVIADTYLRGIRDFDVQSAYQFLTKSSDANSNNLLRPEANDYNNLGYVPVDNEGTWDGTVSTSLEYYVADYALGQLAKALGKEDDFVKYNAKSTGYKKLFDQSTGMLRPKYRSGEWLTPYDPELGRDFEPAPGYVEGNAWNYRFYVPHDMNGLISLLGGDKPFLEQLLMCFETDNYDMANEPDITYPFLFNYVKGEEWRTQQKVLELINQHYLNAPNGIPGNDDAGTLSTWVAFSMLGIYPLSPADMNFTLFTPSFEQISIQLSEQYYGGNTLLIRANKATADAQYIQQKRFNGKVITDYFLSHQLLSKGGILEFDLISKPQ